ncbi:MAG: hypothetical protein HQL19_01055 [Candidatus Omnitrophica bacterium]|nr:hypothetical protein [Candidatus Omnitrophota bacterium]
MGFVRLLIMTMLAGGLGGCVSSGVPLSTVAYDEGYRQGVKENLGKMAEGMNGNGFPYLSGGSWAAPLVQDVRIPAHVQGGIMYPEHNELVIITPGEWKRAGGFPLLTDVSQGVQHAEVLAVDITALPRFSQNERLIK